MARVTHIVALALVAAACAEASSSDPAADAARSIDAAAASTDAPLGASDAMPQTPDAMQGSVDAASPIDAPSGAPDAAASIDAAVTYDAPPPPDATITYDAPPPPPDAMTPLGSICTAPVDVSAASFPYTLSGTFGDDPAAGGSCDTTPHNAVYFSYTPNATGFFEITVQNQTTTNAYARLAVFSGLGCSPYGAQLSCASDNSKTVSTQVSLTMGTPYLIVAYTDGDIYTMVDPVITITELTGSDGEFCAAPADVSAVSFPHQLSGTFSDDPSVGASCDTTATNAAWFSYSPAASGWYDLDLSNSTTTTAYSRVAVFETTSCSPYGAELACETSLGKTVSAEVLMSQGTDYTILFYTDGDTYTMVDPSITVARAAPSGGDLCANAVDVSAATFPMQLVGSYHDDPAQGGTCDTTPHNAVFYTYTAPATATVTVSVTNATTTNAYSRLAIFDTAACSPYGSELACVSDNSKSASTTLNAVQNTTYLIVFYTDGDQYTMVDPTITIN